MIYQLEKLTKLLWVVMVTKECKHLILEKIFAYGTLKILEKINKTSNDKLWYNFKWK